MKDYIFTSIQTKQDDNSDYFIVDGMASTYGNIDLGSDRVMFGAFSKDLSQNGDERPLLFSHDMKQPIGLCKFYDTIKGLAFTAKLPKNDDFVSKRVIPQIMTGGLKGCSIGYETVDAEYNTIDKCRDLKTLKLYETSICVLPMNPKCSVLSVKNFINTSEFKSMDVEYKNYFNGLLDEPIEYKLLDENTEWNIDKAISSLDGYKEGFFFENKYPFAYKIDNEIRVVPKALYQMVGIISGKSKIQIPDNEIKNIKSVINKYYKKLGKELPFKEDGKTFIDIETLKGFENRDLIKIFDNDIILSNNAKEYAVNSLSKPVEVKGDDESGIIARCKELQRLMEAK